MPRKTAFPRLYDLDPAIKPAGTNGVSGSAPCGGDSRRLPEPANVRLPASRDQNPATREQGRVTGDRESAARAAFTLIEILLVLAVIALLSSLFLTGVAVLTARDEQTLEEVFEQAVREAKWKALDGGRPVTMEFDDEKKAFVLRRGGGEVLAEYPVELGGDSVRVRFFHKRPRDGYVLIRGELVQTDPVDRVAFFPDGSSTPFTIELRYGGDMTSYPVDPWTGARLPE